MPGGPAVSGPADRCSLRGGGSRRALGQGFRLVADPFAVALAAVTMAACSSGKAPSVAEGPEHVACALAGAQAFAPVCAVERSSKGGELTLVVRHPDGAFRRLSVVGDGRGLVVADGAQEAEAQLRGGQLEVALGDDRYMFPVTLKNARP